MDHRRSSPEDAPKPLDRRIPSPEDARSAPDQRMPRGPRCRWKPSRAGLLGATTTMPPDQGSVVDLASGGNRRRACLKVLPPLPALGEPLPPHAPKGAIAATRLGCAVARASGWGIKN